MKLWEELDPDQKRAVFDIHKNCLVTARAGSGKTRTIVAKVAYLIEECGYNFNELIIFTFNRAAAAEVNERVGMEIALTFHKFALDIVKMSGKQPEIINEEDQDKLIEQILLKNLQDIKLTPHKYRETLQLVRGFITRAGQKYADSEGVMQLEKDIAEYCGKHTNNSSYQDKIWLHRVVASTYRDYLKELPLGVIDFNILMSRAAEIINDIAEKKILNAKEKLIYDKLSKLKYIMVDEYQDFSYLFYSLVIAIRKIASCAKLFAVGDDWQAINRFAGSDVNYFLHFAEYFPEDSINLPLSTNYRSGRKIVENANKFMLSEYNPDALPAKPFQKKRGKIVVKNYLKIRFSSDDYYEDALGDGKYIADVLEATEVNIVKNINKQRKGSSLSSKILKDVIEVARLLKQTAKLISRHPSEGWLILHRNNTMSIKGVSLENFRDALRKNLCNDNIMSELQFDQNIRFLTIHKSKGLEATNVILLEYNREVVRNQHPHAATFEIFGDTREAEKADQDRLLYVALTRAKCRLYLLTKDRKIV